MPENEKQSKPELKKPAEPEKSDNEGTSAPAIPLPLSPPPETKFPLQFNQQVNVYQIPQNAWDRLTPQETVELTKVILEKADAADRRHFEFAMNQAKMEDAGRELSIKLGSVIALAGFIAAGVLAMYGHELAAVTISLPLATILAVIVGNRFLR
jgi:hypothetical protein